MESLAALVELGSEVEELGSLGSAMVDTDVDTGTVAEVENLARK